ncbi:MAG: hypothetical protein ACREQ5_35580 [Candidatus Dormibacteria bacterium]
MHLKALLTVGAATASLLGGTAGTVLIGHATATPQVQPAPHHVSNPNHPGGTKGKNGSATHKHYAGKGNVKGNAGKGNVKGNAGKGNVKGHPKATPKPKPKPSPSPTPGV